ncbi:MAG: fasciclin domain-containing protein [Pseudomonadota bacterium]
MATIAEIAGGEDFNILLSTVLFIDDQIPEANLVAALSGPGPLTVFAPNDAAFAQLAVDLGFDGDIADEAAVTTFLTANVDAATLRAVVEYHVLAGIFDAAAVTAAESLTTLQGGTIAPDVPTLVDNEPDLLDPSLVATDIAADNGIVHVIDRVLLPIDLPDNDASTITGIVAASGEFDTNDADFDLLLNAVQAAGLAETLDDAEADLTVFAPNDAAFIGTAIALGYAGDATDEAAAFAYLVDALDLLSGGDAIGLLTTILQYHVAGESLQSSQVLASETITTLAGADVTVVTEGGVSFADLDPDLPDPAPVQLDIQAANGIVHVIDGVLLPADILVSDGANEVDFIIDGDEDSATELGADADFFSGKGGADLVSGGEGNDVVLGGDGLDRLLGEAGDDSLMGGADSDRLNGGEGDDVILGGDGGDQIFGGDGNDEIRGEGGNDNMFGMAGDDTMMGGTGADTVSGQDGNDNVSGGSLGDLLFGNTGEDFLNGGFGFDRMAGGADADTFFHLGTTDHGSDWIQDFSAEDTLFVGQAGVTADDFLIQTTHTLGSGSADVEEAFITYIPTGQILFALVDGAGLDSISLRGVGQEEAFDLMV